MRRLAIVPLLLLSALYCANPFSPPKAGRGSLAPIRQQNCDTCAAEVNAGNVLFNFKYAYENRDMDIYENCLDHNFVFAYTDQDREGQIETVEIPRDGVSGDIYRTQGLFDAFSEIRLDTWIPARQGQEDSFTPEHPGEIWEVWTVTFYLSLRDLTGAYSYQQFEASGLAQFKIRKSPDGYWRIVRWEDQSFTNR
jgi:hypothetical protein